MSEFVGYVAAPSTLCYLLFAFGLVARFVRRLQTWSWPLLAISGATNIVFSIGTVATAIISPLEYSYPAVISINDAGDIQHIVALTGWASSDPRMPITGRLNPPSAFRVMLTVELANRCPKCDIVISGSSVAAPVMRDSLLALGINAQRITVDGDAPSTIDSAKNLQRLIGADPFYLVTSAGHMPRSLFAMHAFGLQPIPAPTDYRLPKDWRTAELLPRPLTLEASDLAVHEYLGYEWYRSRTR